MNAEVLDRLIAQADEDLTRITEELVAETGHNVAGYKIAGCRCPVCTKAQRDYARAYARRRKLNRGRPLTIPAVPVRRHVRSLQRRGVGVKTIARLAGCTTVTLHRLLGDSYAINHSLFQAGKPTKRMRRELAARIMAVTVDDVDGAQKIPAANTWRLLDELIRVGWTKAELARRITGPQAKSLQIKRSTVRASTARKVEQVYQELRYQPPPPKRSRHHETAEAPVRLSCDICGKPLLEHRITEPCRRAA